MLVPIKIPEDIYDYSSLYEELMKCIYAGLQIRSEYLKIDSRKGKQMSVNVSNIFDGYVQTVMTKQDAETQKSSLVKVTNYQEIKTFAKMLFDYVIEQIEDPNIQGFIANQCYLAGGCIRNFIMGLPINDIDIYFRTEEYANMFRDLWTKRKYSNDRIFKKDVGCVADTYNAITFKEISNLSTTVPFQFVIKTGGTPEKIVFETFDFENCMGWYDPVSNTIDILVMMKSLESGELIYNSKSSDPLNSIRRLIKFQKMGFEITERCLFDMFKQSKERTCEEQFKKYKFGRFAEY